MSGERQLKSYFDEGVTEGVEASKGEGLGNKVIDSCKSVVCVTVVVSKSATSLVQKHKDKTLCRVI